MKLFNLENKKILFLILGAIFILALALRFYKLESIPVGFHIDEASKGYTAYSILQTGKDDNGNSLPLYIDIFGDNSPSGYHVLTVIPVALFGLTEFSTRFPGALIGAVSIFAIFFLTYSIFRNKYLGVLSALLLAISPWHINLSRASNEGLIALFFIMIGFALVFQSIKTQKKKEIITGTLLLSISFFFYQTPRLFVPLMYLSSLLFFLVIYKVKLKNSFKKLFIGLFVLLAIIDFVLIFVIPGGSGRFSQVNIFTYPETKLVLEEQIREDGVLHTKNLLTRIFHNKIINFPLSYISNYFEYFSFNFLFINNLPPWYFVPNMGVLYIVLFPFVIYGIFKAAIDKSNVPKLLLVWLVLGPVAAATAVDTNNLQRAIVLFPILEILGAFGILSVYHRLPKGKNIFVLIVSLALIANTAYFLHQYFVHTKIHRPWYRNAGFKEMMNVVNSSYNNYDTFIITKSTGGTYPLVQFFSKYDPKTYQSEGSPKDAPYNGFGKFFFVSHECPSFMRDKKYPDGKTLFINNGTCKADIRYKEQVISRPDNTPAFKIIDPSIKMRPDADTLDPEKDF